MQNRTSTSPGKGSWWLPPGRPKIVIFQGKNLDFLLQNLDFCIKKRAELRQVAHAY